MTEDELGQIEARAAESVAVVPPCEVEWQVATDVGVLVAEVRRLRGLVQAAEWLGPVIASRASCPWCLRRQPQGHADDCPAFPPEG